MNKIIDITRIEDMLKKELFLIKKLIFRLYPQTFPKRGSELGAAFFYSFNRFIILFIFNRVILSSIFIYALLG